MRRCDDAGVENIVVYCGNKLISIIPCRDNNEKIFHIFLKSECNNYKIIGRSIIGTELYSGNYSPQEISDISKHNLPVILYYIGGNF